ncbi:alpha/beta hydrolase [Rubrivirga sp. IMCC45206]|uniref:alpha/beta hydrolase n=1 Tax=Rubrivirga sp. IMCC45206 TaxID=3391614 RepID=UPI00399007D4
MPPPLRHDVVFESHGTRCAGWFYVPDGEGPFPTVVMAHGLGCVKEMRLDAFAERFRAAGYACLVFDYRHFGASDGEPRQLLSISRQLEDWAAAVAFARSQPQVDPDRVVLWGSSLSGGHVLEVAADDPRVAAVISQVPHVSGYASLRSERLTTVARLSIHGLYDSVRALLRQPPHYVLSSASEGETGLLNAPGECEGYLGLVPDGLAFDRRVAARFVLAIGLYSPGRALPRLQMPTLVQVARGDLTTPAGPAIEACERAPNATLIQYGGGHFDPYTEPLFGKVVGDQLDFLARHVEPLAGQAEGSAPRAAAGDEHA